MHWSNLNASQINQTAITVSQSPHGDFFFLFKCSMNIPAHCFHTTCLPRQLVNKYDPFIFHSVRLSARQAAAKNCPIEQNQASSTVYLSLHSVSSGAVVQYRLDEIYMKRRNEARAQNTTPTSTNAIPSNPAWLTVHQNKSGDHSWLRCVAISSFRPKTKELVQNYKTTSSLTPSKLNTAGNVYRSCDVVCS